MNHFMKEAVNEAKLGVENRDGGPFGALVVKNGEIISKGHNMVVSTNDPTAHAEIVAIREASKRLNRFDLSDCVLYTTCEPCPMCYSAAHWAKIPIVYYGATREDAAKIGFDDNYIYEVLRGDHDDEKMSIKQIDRNPCLEPFLLFEKDQERTMY